MKLYWSLSAIEDRTAIFDFIERENPRAAAAQDSRIEQAVEILEHFSNAGRVGRVDGTRELPIEGTPYIAVYKMDRRSVHPAWCSPVAPEL